MSVPVRIRLRVFLRERHSSNGLVAVEKGASVGQQVDDPCTIAISGGMLPELGVSGHRVRRDHGVSDGESDYLLPPRLDRGGPWPPAPGCASAMLSMLARTSTVVNLGARDPRDPRTSGR
jgi:hypothetical protein